MNSSSSSNLRCVKMNESCEGIAIVSDFKVAVSWVNSDGLGSLKHVNIIYDIRNGLINLAKERSSLHYGNRQSRREEARGHGERRSTGGSRDFREKLVSVFIVNLNSKVDVACLWGVFKVFGRVRDAFLSSKNSLRKSRHPFVRFESMEEAIKVANSVDGIHVYGWPISAKIAKFNWNNRRSVEIEKSGGRTQSEKMGWYGFLDRGSAEWVHRNGSKNQRSYAEAVRGPQTGFKEKSGEKKDQDLSTTWKKQKFTANWLSKYAIGTLKECAIGTLKECGRQKHIMVI
ncbi:hypothetical protein Dsin_005584 [Dipteronia sinensis]|uniref:RRM domain-containing protein n=1 Tax=Dipteronia sinensis TaxID=43782 RepID=A0AAE0AX49_9ROSI|nr:hypothetical protein Dsin_005584 [Dipteronia sinensis]